MNAEKINELITVCHEHAKERGEWSSIPREKVLAHCYSDVMKDNTEARNAYLAKKLDLITEAIVDAMRARRKGVLGEAKGDLWMHRIYNTTFGDNPCAELEREYKCQFDHNYKGSYPDHLTLAAIRTMDLMGFYGVECQFDSLWANDCAVELMRNTEFNLCSDRALTITDTAIFDGVGHIRAILRIAELDEIDLEWHINARLKYEQK